MAPKATSPPPSFVVAQIHCEHKQRPLLTYIFDPTCDCCIDRDFALTRRKHETTMDCAIRSKSISGVANLESESIETSTRNAFTIVFKLFFPFFFQSRNTLAFFTILENLYE